MGHQPSATPTGCSTSTAAARRARSELSYNDIDGDGYLSDNERDEDADGLTNYDESHGRMFRPYWDSCYANEKPYYIDYQGTDLADPDTDGDGVRDGADDQDHDDIPNLDGAEPLRCVRRPVRRGEHLQAGSGCAEVSGHEPPGAYGRMNPFNPCLPYPKSRTCPMAVNGGTGAPFDGSPNWYSLQ